MRCVCVQVQEKVQWRSVTYAWKCKRTYSREASHMYRHANDVIIPCHPNPLTPSTAHAMLYLIVWCKTWRRREPLQWKKAKLGGLVGAATVKILMLDCSHWSIHVTAKTWYSHDHQRHPHTTINCAVRSSLKILAYGSIPGTHRFWISFGLWVAYSYFLYDLVSFSYHSLSRDMLIFPKILLGSQPHAILAPLLATSLPAMNRCEFVARKKGHPSTLKVILEV